MSDLLYEKLMFEKVHVLIKRSFSIKLFKTKDGFCSQDDIFVTREGEGIIKQNHTQTSLKYFQPSS